MKHATLTSCPNKDVDPGGVECQASSSQIKSAHEPSPNTKKLLLHLGPDKTGSTLFQEVLTKNSCLLKSLGIGFLDIPTHGILGSVFNDDPLSYVYNIANGFDSLNSIKDRDEEFQRELDLLVNNDNYHTVIFSYEGLYYCSRGVHENINQYFLSSGFVLDVVCFCRPPVSYAISAASQRAKDAGLAWESVPVHPHGDVLPVLENVYGSASLRVLKYNKHSSEIEFFANIIGRQAEDMQQLDFKIRSYNKSLSGPAFEMANYAVKFLDGRVGWKFFRRYITPVLENVKGGAIQISGDIYQSIIDASSKHTEFIGRVYNIEFESELEFISRNDNCSGSEFINSIDYIHALIDGLLPFYSYKINNYSQDIVLLHSHSPSEVFPCLAKYFVLPVQIFSRISDCVFIKFFVKDSSGLSVFEADGFKVVDVNPGVNVFELKYDFFGAAGLYIFGIELYSYRSGFDVRTGLDVISSADYLGGIEVI